MAGVRALYGVRGRSVRYFVELFKAYNSLWVDPVHRDQGRVDELIVS